MRWRAGRQCTRRSRRGA